MQDTTKEKLFLLVPILAFVVILLLIYVYYIRTPAQQQQTAHQLPEISVPLLFAPNTEFTNSNLNHTVALLTFWNTQCQGCQEQHNLLKFIATVHLVSLYGIDYRDEPHTAKQFLQKYGNPYKTVALDRQGRIGLILGVDVIPETFLIGPQGKVRDLIVGPVTPIVWFDRLKPEIEGLKKSANR